MSNDLIERLRDVPDSKLSAYAADEIERLQARVASLEETSARYVKMMDRHVDGLVSENESLRNELVKVQRDFDSRIQKALQVNEQRLDELTAARELLREAREEWLQDRVWVGGVENGSYQKKGSYFLEFTSKIDAFLTDTSSRGKA